MPRSRATSLIKRLSGQWNSQLAEGEPLLHLEELNLESVKENSIVAKKASGTMTFLKKKVSVEPRQIFTNNSERNVGFPRNK